MLWSKIRPNHELLPFVNTAPTTLLRQAEALLAGDTDSLEQFADFAAARLEARN